MNPFSRQHYLASASVTALLLSASAVSPVSAATADEDFQARCSAAGVLVCEGFNNSSTFVYSNSQSEGLYPVSGTNTLRGFQDTSVKASGASSLRFDIPSNSDADVAGNFSKNFGRTFSQGSTFYVQFQQRFDDNYVSIDWSAMGTSPKHAIFYDRNGMTCANVEITTVNNYSTGRPIIYSECGNRAVRTSISDISHFTTSVPYLLQQGASGTSGYNCQYNNEFNGTGNGSGCFKVPANKWVTFYYKVTVGTWGQPNSQIQAWVSFDGGPYQQWTNVRDYTLYSDGSSSGGFSRVMLTSYMTGKNTSVGHPTAHTWYDDLIISAQPIAAPGASGSNIAPPSAPTALRAQ